jgi:hypothetical protein
MNESGQHVQMEYVFDFCCFMSASGISGFEPSCSADTVVIIGRLYLCSRFIFEAKAKLNFKKEILNSNSCMFSTLEDFYKHTESVNVRCTFECKWG